MHSCSISLERRLTLLFKKRWRRRISSTCICCWIGFPAALPRSAKAAVYRHTINSSSSTHTEFYFFIFIFSWGGCVLPCIIPPRVCGGFFWCLLLVTRHFPCSPLQFNSTFSSIFFSWMTGFSLSTCLWHPLKIRNALSSVVCLVFFILFYFIFFVCVRVCCCYFQLYPLAAVQHLMLQPDDTHTHSSALGKS